MSPKKAIAIILVLFLITVTIFIFLYLNKQLKAPVTNSQESAQNNPDLTRENIINSVNEEIIKQEQAKTPEQIKIEEKDQTERQKAIDQINEQIKSQNNMTE